MNTVVNFEIAKLLKAKGFKTRVPNVWLFSLGKAHLRNVHLSLKLNDAEYNAPTIAEAVMWLYEKHGIWVSVTFKRHSQNKHFSYNIRQANGIETYLWEHNSPTEAYEAAILYCLTKLI